MKTANTVILIAACTLAILIVVAPAAAMFGPGFGQFAPFGPRGGFPGYNPYGYWGPGGYPYPAYGFGGYPGYDNFNAGNEGLDICINMPGIGSISLGQFGSGISATSIG